MKFIQVGVGGHGQRWVDLLKSEKKAEVVGLVDINAKSLERICEKTGYDSSICFPALKEALQKVKADAVVCVTPPKNHRETVIQAMEAGLHVICEKPMAEDPEDCTAMLDTSRKTGKTYVISQNYRYSPEMFTLADQVRKGALGEIGQVQIDFWKGNDFNGGFRHTMDFPVLVDMSIHHFDLIRFITGLNAKNVSGHAWNPPWSNYKGDCSSTVLFEMENRARVIYNASWCAKGSYCDWNGNWHIEGSKGTLVYENGNMILHEAPNLYKVEKTTPVSVEKPERQGAAFVLNDFIRSVEEGKKPASDGFENIHSIAMVFGAVEAVKTGKTQKLDRFSKA